jgi:hypothetical protein
MKYHKTTKQGIKVIHDTKEHTITKIYGKCFMVIDKFKTRKQSESEFGKWRKGYYKL